MKTSRRGAAMITVMMLMGALALIVIGVLAIARAQRTRAAISARAIQRLSCAENGLQFARSFFANRQTQWDAMLAAPTTYNPVRSYWNVNPADPSTAAGVAAIKAVAMPVAGSSLFVDLDGDGDDDVYIYVRDNDDELLPAPTDWSRDNDQNVIVGSMCISNTLTPRRSTPTDPVTERLVVESMLSFNALVNSVTSQATHGPSGSGNLN